MTINTSRALKNLTGESLKNGDKDFTLGEALANIMIADESGGKMKLYILATKFMEGKRVELDASDFSLVKSAVEQSKVYTSLVSGQALVMLEEGDEKPKK